MPTGPTKSTNLAFSTVAGAVRNTRLMHEVTKAHTNEVSIEAKPSWLERTDASEINQAVHLKLNSDADGAREARVSPPSEVSSTVSPSETNERRQSGAETCRTPNCWRDGARVSDDRHGGREAVLCELHREGFYGGPQ